MDGTTRTTRRGRPGQLDHDKLIAAALDLGVDRLTLRDVADTLGVPRTTVYNHVRSPEELGRMVLSSILDRFEAGTGQPSRSQPWSAQLEAFAARTRAELLTAGPWLRFYDPDRHLTDASLRTADHLIKTMIEAGLSAETAGRALTLVVLTVRDSMVRTPRRADGVAASESYLRGLDRGSFPWIAAAFSSGDYTGEEQFRFNLKCSLTGIRALVR